MREMNPDHTVGDTTDGGIPFLVRTLGYIHADIFIELSRGYNPPY